MKRILIAALVAVLPSAVLAADLPNWTPPVAVAPQHATDDFSWTSFYAGGHVGYGAANIDGQYDSSVCPPPTCIVFGVDPDGVVGGVHAGYNHQLGNIVLGIEGDASFADWSDTVENPTQPEYVIGDIDLLATIRGRVGYAWGRHLLYGTGGVAIVDGSFYADEGGGGTDGITRFTKVGGVVGGGLEWAVHDKVSLRAEGLYYIVNDGPDITNLNADSDATDFAELKDAWVVRGGISFHLPH